MFKDKRAFSSFSVDDLGRAKAFYGETLGLSVVEEKSMGLELRLAGGGEVFIYPKEDHAPATFTVLNFMVEGIERVVDALTEAGVEFEHYETGGIETDERGIFLAAPGMKIAWFTDPAGNVLSVIEDKRD